MNRILALVFVLLSLCAGLAQAQTLSASPSSLYSSQPVTATWSGIAAPTATDWVGLYPAGAADNAFVAWIYTDGNASGSGPLQVPANAAAGTYELRLFAANGYTLLATSNSFSVQTPPPATLSESPGSVYSSQSVTATWATIFAPTATDWVGLYPPGAADNAFVAWFYTDGSASGSGPLQVPANAAAGTYELRLFSANGYTLLATSNSFSVQTPPAATLSVTPPSVQPGGSVTAAWTNIFAPTATDWIGLYAPGAPDNAFISWRYTDGTAAGNVPFSIGASVTIGTYELRLFSANGYTRLATSAAFSVGQLKLFFIHPDHLNTPRLVADSIGTTVWRWDNQEPFGADTPNGDPENTGTTFDLPLRFPGQYSDKETDRAYNYFRYYDAATGRYVQSDPIGLVGGLNTYSYVAANPIRNIDPTGQFVFPLLLLPPAVEAVVTTATVVEVGVKSLILGGAIITGVNIASSPDLDPDATVPLGKCPFHEDDCEIRYWDLMKKWDVIKLGRASGYNMAHQIADYRRRAFVHNSICWPRWQVPTMVK